MHRHWPVRLSAPAASRARMQRRGWPTGWKTSCARRRGYEHYESSRRESHPMRALPLSIGTLHFVGIGGIGMSGIAEVLHNLGYSVQGSDIAESGNVQRLRAAGIPVAIGHDAANLGRAQVAVVSTAVKRDNPE